MDVVDLASNKYLIPFTASNTHFGLAFAQDFLARTAGSSFCSFGFTEVDVRVTFQVLQLRSPGQSPTSSTLKPYLEPFKLKATEHEPTAWGSRLRSLDRSSSPDGTPITASCTLITQTQKIKKPP